MAIRKDRNCICIFNPEEVEEFKRSNQHPDHRGHPHIRRKKAEALVASLLFSTPTVQAYEAYWVDEGKTAIRLHDLKGPRVTTAKSGHVGIQWR